MWEEYNERLRNEEFLGNAAHTQYSVEQISLGEAQTAVNKMKRSKAVGP